MDNVLEKFVEEARVAFGDNLKSVVLYGSRASGEAVEKYSDYNLLLILEKINMTQLSCFAKKLKRNKKITPVIFTENGFKKSIDVFPIEFIEMQEHHNVLYGNNPFDGLKIDYKNLRHEVEFELRGKLLKLIQTYLVIEGNQNETKKLIANSIATFLVLFRHIIRLTGEIPSLKRLDALDKIAELVGINKEPFISAMKIKGNVKEAKKIAIEELFDEYVKEIEKVINFIDNL